MPAIPEREVRGPEHREINAVREERSAQAAGLDKYPRVTKRGA